MNNSTQTKLIIEFLQLYRDLPCLWDNREILYNNKEARDKAFEVLCEKYKQIQIDITIPEMKKKLENMRTAFRREHKKVLRSRLRGEIPEYTPSLFYYDHMQFINEVAEYPDVAVDVENSMIKAEYEDNPRKSRPKKRNLSSVYLREPEIEPETEEYDEDDQEEQVSIVNPDTEMNDSSHNNNTACEAFGTTVGYQLKELNHMQRVFAEKLISDVIFNGRLQRLSVNSSIHL